MKTFPSIPVTVLALMTLVFIPGNARAADEPPSVAQAIAGNERRIEAVRQSNLEPLDKAALIALLRNRIADLRDGTAEPISVDPADVQPSTAPSGEKSIPPAIPVATLPGRRVTINGGAPNAEMLLALEARCRTRLRDGDYWYDAVSGACGLWGGPTAGFLPPGLALGRPLPANASGGGTGVVLNNRELHPADVVNLNQLLALVNSQLPPGRWTLDHAGNLGPEGGPALVNLKQIMAAVSANNAGQGGGNGGFGAGGGGGGGRDNYWSSRYGAGNEDANGTGYVYIPGTGSVMYGP